MARRTASVVPEAVSMPATRGYQQEMLEESMRSNIIIALDTGSGKTHIAVLRMKNEVERQPTKVSWFVAPTVALCQQQRNTIQTSIPVSVGIISGSLAPEQWKNAGLWREVLRRHRIMVTTPQVLLDAMRHGYVHLGRDISLLVFDEAHHAVDKHPYNVIMDEFYFRLPLQTPTLSLDIARPTILGLTASPIYGGNVVKAFQTIENNLDSVIRAPQRYRMELAKFVHRPVFRHILYAPVDEMMPPFSTNLASLLSVIRTLNIEDDPYVRTLRQQLAKATHGTSEYSRIDQRLSGVIFKENTFTHRGLRDFARTAEVILFDLGPWAADWYVWQVLEKAKHAANPYNNVISTWKNSEKTYLLGILDKIVVSPVSFYPDDIADDSSDKVRALIDCLLSEKHDTETENESYSGLVFVQRRDAVLALTEVLRHHPRTKGLFQLGCLLGTSDNSRRHSFLDITRTLIKEPQEEILSDFKIGERNVIVSTAVAEEGIDIQACGSVIRWDPPTNMASWAQSRGRARRQRSTFTLMFERGGNHQKDIVKWVELEQQMVALYNDPSRELETLDEVTVDDEEDDVEFRVTSTGALLTLHSAVSHLAHFCAVIPTTSHVDNAPLYDTEPPELPEGWHSYQPRSKKSVIPYPGPFGSKVTLPRCLHLPTREFSVGLEYKTRISAHRHAAFKAYLALYDAELLNDHLLPITSVVEPQLEDEVKALLRDVEKRAGFANVSIQMDPWAPEEDEDCWRMYVLIIDTLPPLRLLTRSGHISLPEDKGPLLYRSGYDPLQCYIKPAGVLSLTDTIVVQAQEYTRRLFWSLNGSRMKWDNLDFSYLFLPIHQDADTQWETRRTWLTEINRSLNLSHADEFFANGETFGAEYLYPDDIAIVRNGFQFAKGYHFVRWRFEVLSPEEEVEFRENYSRFSDLEITYPLLVVEPLPPRTNFLIPTPPPTGPPSERKTILLLPRLSSIVLLSKADIEYAFLLPSVLRSVSMALTAESLRRTLFIGTPLFDIPLPLLITATTAPVSGEKHNYQRLETLGDTVLKFVVGIQLIAEYPLWHEGYLTKRKDHAVSNVRLAKEDIAKGVYRWIIRDRMLGKKWKPMYLTNQDTMDTPADTTTENDIEPPQNESGKSKKKPKQRQELSTKVLADVIESLIGAAYIHGSFDLGYECAKFFDLGLKWAPLQTRIESLLLRIETHDNLPRQLEMVEHMLGYTFQRKHILIEALTHASYEQDPHTSSYERLEFLGDSVLDMVVTDFLYHAPGKNYSPGHLFLRKSAMVNAHILAYVCLRTCVQIDAAMPGPSPDGHIAFQPDTHLVYLWQCLLHSSPRVLEDQANSHARFMKRRDVIEDSLRNGDIFPWAELTRLQAPKFLSDIIESLLGAAFLDSSGNLDVAKSVVRQLGIMQIMEHIVEKDVDVLHPVSRLSLWAGKHDRELKYEYEKEKGNVSCIIMVDGKEEVRQTDVYRGLASQEQAKFLAAEKAIKMFRLRDVNMNYTLMKRKTTPKKKKSKKNVQKDSKEPNGVNA